ncbi:MAG: hypothetical protein ACYTGV_04195 [Planctomycetota bacterium]|jgi:hypothetical protein
MRRLRVIIACCLLGSAAGAYLVSSAEVSGRFVFERVPSDRRPIEIFVDTESVTGVADPRAVTQDLMNQWNSVSGAEVVFGNARIGGPYNGSTVGETFGTFTNSEFEVAFDDTGEIFGFFGVSPGVLGITLKSVDTGSGRLLDFLVVINTRPSALSDPGSGATSEELFRSTLLHELGHTLGLSHTAVGLANTNSFGFSRAAPSQMPSMYAFRIPIRPQEGMTLEGDDTAAVVRNYPAGTGVAGSISGSVRTAGGTPVNTIHVRAVGPEGGTIEHIGVLTNEDGREQGRYTIEGVPPGVYRVILETVNGRAAIDGGVLAGGSDGLGSEPFVYAADEHWQPGDTFDPAFDDPAEFALIRVRPGGDTGSINFVLNGAPIFDGQQLDRELDTGDTQVPDQVGGFHFADYYVFQGSSGQDVTITDERGRSRSASLGHPGADRHPAERQRHLHDSCLGEGHDGSPLGKGRLPPRPTGRRVGVAAAAHACRRFHHHGSGGPRESAVRQPGLQPSAPSGAGECPQPRGALGGSGHPARVRFGRRPAGCGSRAAHRRPRSRRPGGFTRADPGHAQRGVRSERRDAGLRQRRPGVRRGYDHRPSGGL